MTSCVHVLDTWLSDKTQRRSGSQSVSVTFQMQILPSVTACAPPLDCLPTNAEQMSERPPVVNTR